MERREFVGSVIQTTLAANISNSATTIQLVSGNTFPTGSNYPFVIVINRGFPAEEKVLISSRTGANLAVSQRGYDGTTANSHSAGVTIDHVLDAYSLQSMNINTFDNSLLMWMGV